MVSSFPAVAALPSADLVALRSHARVRAVIDQVADGRRVAIAGGQHQRGFAGAVPRIDPGFGLDQQAHGLQVAAPRGGHQRRAAIGDADVGIGAGGQQQPHHAVAAAHGRRLIERRAAFHLPGVDGGAARQEHRHLRLVVDGPQQGRGAAAVLRVHVRTSIEEQGQRVHAPEASRMVQERRTRRIGRVHQIAGTGDGRLRLRSRPRSHRGNQRRQPRVDRPRRRFLRHIVAEVRALVDPRTQDADLLGQQRAGRRHLHAAVTVHQAMNQLALAALAGHDDRPVVAAAQGVLAQVEPEARLLHLGAVARVAVLRQQGLDVLLVVHRRWRRGLR